MDEPGAHRVACLDGPDEILASQLEQVAAKEVSAAQMAAAATYLLWASDISPDRVGRERRLLTAALYLTRLAESRGLELRDAERHRRRAACVALYWG